MRTASVFVGHRPPWGWCGYLTETSWFDWVFDVVFCLDNFALLTDNLNNIEIRNIRFRKHKDGVADNLSCVRSENCRMAPCSLSSVQFNERLGRNKDLEWDEGPSRSGKTVGEWQAFKLVRLVDGSLSSRNLEHWFNKAPHRSSSTCKIACPQSHG